ncbi:hypothetical protein Q5P01_023158 [Channa striata]|uniref:Deoxyribonuclease-2-alpha n=1 Tax=Channa striata TaxID=64152 RepID=A0AA88ISV4_CHASR|nr:hypothetical protein Q5P01_023158 [Channa striata]
MWRLVLVVALLCLGSEAHISCKNEKDEDVDWYILYKFPEIKDKLNGGDYIYIDSKGNEKNSKPINDKDSFLANTLKPILTNPPGCGFISYNDQPPTGSSVSDKMGHSKGVVMLDKTHLVWLLHSTPNFPSKRDTNDFYPVEGLKFGQTFICVTLPHTANGAIVKHLQFINAYVFDHQPDGFPNNVKVTKNKLQPSLNTNDQSQLYGDLKTAGGVELKHFYKKTSKYGLVGDLYVTIAKELQDDLYVQTWGRQFCRDFTYCPTNGHKVFNVEDIDTQNIGKWNRVNDHSKWCVPTNNNKHWICIADSNRAVSQYERPGGALCIKNEKAAETFRGFVVKTVENCPPTEASSSGSSTKRKADTNSQGSSSHSAPVKIGKT